MPLDLDVATLPPLPPEENGYWFKDEFVWAHSSTFCGDTWWECAKSIRFE